MLDHLVKNYFNSAEITTEKYHWILKMFIYEHMEDTFPSKIRASLIDCTECLYDVLELSEELLQKKSGFGPGKIEEFRRFKYKIENDKEYFIRLFFQKVATFTLPFNYDPEDEILVNFNRLLYDLLAIYEVREDKRSIRVAKVIKPYFGINSELLDRSEIAKQLGLNAERVRQILMDENVVMHLFNTNGSGDGIFVHHDFLNSVRGLNTQYFTIASSNTNVK